MMTYPRWSNRENYYVQSHGQHLIPLLRGDPDIVGREIAGVPHNSLIAVSPRGCVKRMDNRRRFVRGLRLVIEALEPCGIVSYGTDVYGVLDYPKSLGIPVHEYQSRGRGALGGDLNVKVR